MVCPNCGRRTFKREAVCPKCGAPMPTERQNTEGESNLNQRFRRNPTTSDGNVLGEETMHVSAERPPYAPSPAETPVYSPAEVPNPPADEVPPSVFVPEIEFKPVNQPVANPSDDGSLHSETSTKPEFYGSYGEACNVKSQPASNPEFVPQEFSPAFSTEAPKESSAIPNEWNLPDNSGASSVEPKSEEKIEFDDEDSFNPILPDLEEDDELVLPDFANNFSQSAADGESDKSMNYEKTVELKNARKAYKNEAPINQPIKTASERTESAPKVKEFTAVASGTAKVKGDLPKLKENQIYVALTPKEFRQLKSKKLRGLGIICTLCLVIISSFCIWSYANSFADPLVGRWKGDIKSANIPIEAIQQMDQDLLNSTWEFSSSGSMYLNITLNDTPISLSGTYTEHRDEKGEQYIAMTLNNPMDNSSYTFNMYYTVTGKVLEFNDMEGMGMAIDLTKE